MPEDVIASEDSEDRVPTGARNGPRSARRLWQRARGLLYFRKPPDEGRGARLALRAAEAGCAGARVALARWYALGLHGFPESEERARDWLARAAQAGSRTAVALRRLREDA